MRINPVLKNELKLSTRSIKFTLIILVYVGILSTIGISIFHQLIKDVYFEGLYIERTLSLYIIMAIAQALLLMFIVPSLSATAICAEREKQTLDILLSTKMSTLSIIMGKLTASISRVILLIICTIPIYSIMFFTGGIDYKQVVQLSLFFIVVTIFCGSIGIFISTLCKTSRTSTAITYGTILFIFVAMFFCICVYIVRMQMFNSKADFPIWAYMNPTMGFVSLLANQLGLGFIVGASYMISNLNMDTFEYGYLISMAMQLFISGILIFISSYRLNPLHIGSLKRRE